MYQDQEARKRIYSEFSSYQPKLTYLFGYYSRIPVTASLRNHQIAACFCNMNICKMNDVKIKK